jgi:hypothetical protein
MMTATAVMAPTMTTTVAVATSYLDDRAAVRANERIRTRARHR